MSKVTLSFVGTAANPPVPAAALRGLERILKRANELYVNEGTYATVDLAKFPNAAQLFAEYGVRWLPRKGSTVVKITDAVFDSMMEILKDIDPKSPLLKQVGAEVPTKGKRQPKVDLPQYMGSLDKIKPDTADAWLEKRRGPYVLSNKLDGISILLKYLKGKAPRAFTRGNGRKGQDISKLVPHLKIPQKLDRDLEVRGEIVMSEQAFKSKWAKEFENARNLTAGVVGRVSIHPAVQDVDVIIYDVLTPRGLPSQQLAEMKSLGFHVVPHITLKTVTQKQLSILLKARKLQSKHAIDGLVLSQDKQTSLMDGTNPEHAVAYKETADEDIAVVKVKEVVWTASKNNLLKPRVNIDPIRLSGVTVKFATGFNAFFIKNGFRTKDKNKGLPVRPVGPGAVIRITRSGDVIPHIIEVVKGARTPSMPDEAYTWTKTGSDIIQSEASDLSAKKRVVYFFAKLDVEGLRMGTVSKFFDYGLDTVLKIVKAPKSKFLEIDGIQERTAEKLRTGIDQALAKMTLPALMDASGFFGALGEKRLTLITNKHPDILRSSGSADLINLVLDIPGFKNTLAMQFVRGLPKFVKFYERLGVKARAPKRIKIAGTAFANQVVVFSGFRNAQAEETIKKQGGTIGTGVNNKTTLLVVKDKNGTSSKIKTARDLKIKVISGIELQARLARL